MKRPLLIVIAVAALLAWIGLRQYSGTRKVVTQLRPAPDFSLTDVSGQKLALSNYRGRVVLLDFWATWCDPCKQEIPHFVEMQNRYGPRGLQVVGISMDDDEKPVRDFQQQFKMNYPIAIGSPKLAEQYGGILGLPVTFVIDREGLIYSRHIGQTEASVFDNEIKELLRPR